LERNEYLRKIMKKAHSIKLRVHCKETEIFDDILKSFLDFFPFGLEKNKIALIKTQVEGALGNKIIILEAEIRKDNLISDFFDFLLAKLNLSQKKLLLDQIESRLDSNLDFFIRFDKSLWINDRILELTDEGNCFHLKIAIAAYPKKKDTATNTIKLIFN